ncbi:MAG TPA: D-alanyl-D-alanine carboxypeptidase/D-alanyl-D-alanine-endopeptidase [Chitinivibrionales bacterium]
MENHKIKVQGMNRNFCPWRLAIGGILFFTGGLFAQNNTQVDADKIVYPSMSVKLKALLEKNHYPVSSVGVLFKNIEKDSIIAALNPNQPFNPASVSKLATAAMAFDKLGTNYTFKTRFYAQGAYDPDVGICKGNFYIKGGADPLLVIERMWIIVQYLHRFNGLRSIEGDIVLDDSFFDTTAIGPCFIDDSMAANPYAAPVGALTANFNTVGVYVRPSNAADEPVQAELFPQLPNVELLVRAKTSAQRKTSGVFIESERNKGQTRMVVTGSMPLNAEPRYILRKVRQTWEYFGEMFKMFLNENQITCKGTIRRGLVPDTVKAEKPLYTWDSPPLWEAVADMMKFSTNLCAEMVFKTLSAVRDSGGGSWEKSSAMIEEWWKEKGLAGTPVIKNGSGMGDCNRFSVSQLCALLSFVWTQKAYLPEYLNGFPIAGNDGTLKSRFKNSRLKNYVRGKTGTLNDERAYSIAGYVLMPKADYAFAIVFNNAGPKMPYQHWEMEQKILEMLVPE